MGLFDDVVTGVRAHDIEGAARLLGGHRLVSDLVEMVVNDLTQIDEGILLNLNLSVHINLYS
jgi:hypothetical protein